MTASRGAFARTLEVRSPAMPVVRGRPLLEAVRHSGHEGVNSLFEHELVLRTPDSPNSTFTDAANIDLNAFLSCEMCCIIAATISLCRGHIALIAG